ncbi:MAG: DNA repair protein RadC [Syntrophales bacterium]|nr:DNA repair protein RadC [Syntrophales bacterium]
MTPEGAKGAQPHYHGHRQRLKERYLEAGLDALGDHEKVELLLSFCLPRKDVKPLAKDLLRRFTSLKGIMDAPAEELVGVPGVGVHTAVLIKLVKDLSAAYLLEKARERIQISSSDELMAFCKTKLGGLKDERFYVCYLDVRNRLIAMELIQEGTVNQAVVYPRKILEGALKHKASAMILIHNHPSGHVQPSDADIRLTRIIQDAARIMDIPVHDHVIVGENHTFSLRQEGLMG